MEKQEIIDKIKADPSSLKDMPEEILADKEIMIAVVTHYGPSLQYASKELKEDKEIVISVY